MHFLNSFRHVTRKLNSPFTQRIVWTVLWMTACSIPSISSENFLQIQVTRQHMEENCFSEIKRSQGKFKSKCNSTWFSDSKNNKKIQVYVGFALTKSSNFCFDWHIEKYRSARNMKFRIALADNRTEGRKSETHDFSLRFWVGMVGSHIVLTILSKCMTNSTTNFSSVFIFSSNQNKYCFYNDWCNVILS